MMEDNLWSLSNVITGFSIAQCLAFLYALGKDLHTVQVLNYRQKVPLALSILIFSIFYLVALWQLSELAKQLPSEYPLVWIRVTSGRYAAVILFALLSAVGLFAPEIFMKLGRTSGQSK